MRRPVRSPADGHSPAGFCCSLVCATAASLTGRRSGESGTFGAVGPVPNSMFMVFAFYNAQTERPRATSTRKYHHRPLLIGAFGAIPLVENRFYACSQGILFIFIYYFYYTALATIIHLSAGFRIITSHNSKFNSKLKNIYSW